MLLAIDVGNTNTVLGVFDAGKLSDSFRVQTDKDRTGDAYGLQIKALFDFANLRMSDVHDVIVSSVVPPMAFPLEQMSKRFFGRKPLFVGPGVKTGMPVLYDNPHEVGADRIVNSVAAYERYHNACIVVDFGTATTFDCVSGRGEYLGGVITPGIGISLDALCAKTAKLPKVELVKPARVIGKTTVHAIQAGSIYGYVALVDGLVDRIRGELGAGARVIATGGFATLLAPESRTIETVDEFLTLDGLDRK